MGRGETRAMLCAKKRYRDGFRIIVSGCLNEVTIRLYMHNQCHCIDTCTEINKDLGRDFKYRQIPQATDCGVEQ